MAMHWISIELINNRRLSNIGVWFCICIQTSKFIFSRSWRSCWIIGGVIHWVGSQHSYGTKSLIFRYVPLHSDVKLRYSLQSPINTPCNDFYVKLTYFFFQCWQQIVKLKSAWFPEIMQLQNMMHRWFQFYIFRTQKHTWLVSLVFI